jgi:hypothetical protein
MNKIGELACDGIPFAYCLCSCGATFYAAKKDADSGLVKSCGHRFAGKDLNRLMSLRFPAEEEKSSGS